MPDGRMIDTDDGEIWVGSDHISVRRPREQRWLGARILHRVDGAEGQPRWIVLDRLIHRPGDVTLGGYHVRGAVTTELRI